LKGPRADDIIAGAVAESHVRALIEGALRSLADGLAVVDSGGRVAIWNARAEEFLGVPADGRVGAPDKALYEAIATHTRDPVKSLGQMLSAASSPSSMAKVEFYVASPVERVVEAQWFDLHSDVGNTSGYGVLFRDVTHEKELDQMKDQLLSTVSHELRTPLAAIKGFTTTLLRQDVRWDEATQRDFLKIIEEETDRLGELIDNLLDMSKIEAGVLRVEKEPTQLRNVLRESIDRARRRSEAHWFVVDMPAQLPRVWADGRRIRQVLNNLLENAIKYSPGGGQITVTAEVEGDHATVSVADSGQGIPAEFLDRIFQRFFQLDAANTRKTGGSGLGLSISKGIIEANGGKIWAESNPGKGSVFRFTLPLVNEQSSEGDA
jgi:signal transduction histidine kinase